MVSDFITERYCYLALTEDEYGMAKQVDPTIRRYARQQMECGDMKEGYWMSEKFKDQIKQAVKIAEVKYPREEGWRVV